MLYLFSIFSLFQDPSLHYPIPPSLSVPRLPNNSPLITFCSLVSTLLHPYPNLILLLRQSQPYISVTVILVQVALQVPTR